MKTVYNTITFIVGLAGLILYYIGALQQVGAQVTPPSMLMWAGLLKMLISVAVLVWVNRRQFSFLFR